MNRLDFIRDRIGGEFYQYCFRAILAGATVEDLFTLNQEAIFRAQRAAHEAKIVD